MFARGFLGELSEFNGGLYPGRKKAGQLGPLQQDLWALSPEPLVPALILGGSKIQNSWNKRSDYSQYRQMYIHPRPLRLGSQWQEQIQRC
jgi:hypothetical protein